MRVSEAIKSRTSTRAFLNRSVSREVIAGILDAAGQCGSFVNSQPWEFAVLGGEVMEQWKNSLWEMFQNGEQEQREYYCGPMPMPEPFMSRGDAFRNAIDTMMFPPGAPEREKRQADYVKSGIIVRDAPVAIIVHMEKSMAESPLHVLAAGGTTQAIALAALDMGLGTCIMGRPVESPRLLRRLTGIPESNLILCCVAIGYADPDAKINSLHPPRAGVQELASWHGL